MSDTVNSAPFPLPLVPFERYLLMDDRPGHPMTGFLAMEFSGEFDRPAFEAALEEALVRHPLFCALLERLPRKGLCWVASAGLMPSLDWNAYDAPLECPAGEAIDPTREVGLRIWVRQSGGRAKVTFQLQHACSDGLGTFQFIGDLLAAYGIRTASAASATVPPLADLQSASLRGRGEFETDLPQQVSSLRIIGTVASEALKFLGRRPVPLYTYPNTCGENTETYEFPGICAQTLDDSRTAALREVAKGRGATLNDLLITDIFRTIIAWNRRCGQRRPGRWMRINMPTNLRGKKDGRMPAANMMSYAFLSRRPRQCDDWDALLDGVRRETEMIKRWRSGLLFLDGIAFAAKMPGLLRLLLAGNRCLATLVLSNLGDPTWHFRTKLPLIGDRASAGNVVLEMVTGATPLRPMTRASLVVSRYAGRLTVCARCDPQVFRSADTRDFLALYCEQLARTAEGSR